jgi:hypothetical protein
MNNFIQVFYGFFSSKRLQIFFSLCFFFFFFIDYQLQQASHKLQTKQSTVKARKMTL